MNSMPGKAEQTSNAGTAQVGRQGVFRVASLSMSCLLGAILLITFLVATRRLVHDPKTGWWRLQPPPIFLYEPGHEVTGQVAIYDELLGWRNVPNSRGTTFGRALTINANGHRGPKRSYRKPPHVSRILVLGDSYTWGYGVGDDEVFAALLQGRLTERDTSWEVLNAGVSGWGTDQEYLYLENDGFGFSPDIVVLALFVGNDPSENMFSIRYSLQKPVFLDAQLSELGNVPVPKPDQNVANQRSSAQPAELTMALVDRIQEACQQRDVPLVVMKFGTLLLPPPAAQRRDPVMREVVREIGRMETELPTRVGSLYLDLDRRFVESGLTPEQIVRGGDHHWNELGHRMTAQFLYEFLVERELVR